MMDFLQVDQTLVTLISVTLAPAFLVLYSLFFKALDSGLPFVVLGKRSDGRPTIGANSCNAHIGHLSTSISGSKAR